MDVPSSLIVVDTRDFNLLEAYMDSWHMDVVQMGDLRTCRLCFLRRLRLIESLNIYSTAWVDFKLVDHVQCCTSSSN